ncbi:NADH-flavin reductase [Streptomyces sp. 150FB]|uniref:NAD(P)-dependent oxidoreductase n=1 Tax=Streptomyces sp. 150FB TaxID=1576605 RepID=UPI000589131C|nr:NAD(P)H-binding protein [Streptomyces sp. 150FB]KIF77397.1 NADH-flavin reductase [Streptomyces sp. 150FB]
MRITVFGAAGNTGSRIVAEALARGHEVTAVVRDSARFLQLPAGASPRVGDAADVNDVVQLGAGQDVVIGATRPPAGSEGELAAVAEALLTGLAGSGARLLVVGGAGSLTVPGSDCTLVVDDPTYVLPAWRDIALACNDQLAVFRGGNDSGGVDWVYLSPPAILEPGERTGSYRLGADELLVDAAGNSAISMEDFAVALLDEIETPSRHRTRFTVGY